MNLRCVAVLSLAALSACATPPLAPARLAEVQRIVERHAAKSKAPGFAIGIIDGKHSSFLGFGKVSPGSDFAPRGDTVYEIGSITKVFTALLLVDLSQDGIVSLNDPAQKWVPPDVRVPRSDNSEILLTHLATHRSGLPRLPPNLPVFSPDPYANYGVDRLYDFLRAHRLKWKVDSRYEYSNLGMGFLGHLLERASGTPYEQLIIQRIADPLLMKDTRVALTGGEKDHLAPPFDERGQPSRNWHFQVMAGAGALRSTVNDLLKFANANLGRGDARLGDLLATCHAPRTSGPRVGLAWHLTPVRNHDYFMTWHNGGTGGYSSFIGFVKETGTAVVVLCNAAPPAPPAESAADRIGYEILELLNP